VQKHVIFIFELYNIGIKMQDDIGEQSDVFLALAAFADAPKRITLLVGQS